MDLTELFALRAAMWAEVKDDPAKVAALREEYAAAGWTLCPHFTCPPYDCQER